ncbi:hypothetical protein OIV83_003863 [Microbotryomycetes sp. JL201]|nr:hypothetical protein OIV83_003863 [Microbotryomycetes sp. JL201]
MAANGPTFTDVDLTDTYADDHSSFTSDHQARDHVTVGPDVHATEADQSMNIRRRALKTMQDVSADMSRMSLQEDYSFEQTRKGRYGQQGRGRDEDGGIERLMAFVDDNMPFSSTRTDQEGRSLHRGAPGMQELMKDVDERRRRDQDVAHSRSEHWQAPDKFANTQTGSEHDLDEEAMREFSRIVSQNGSPVSQHGRPRSRLRDMAPTPTFELQQERRDMASGQDNTAQYSEDATKTSQFNEADVVEELQHARSYIAHLQDELRSINDVVARMNRARQHNSQARMRPPTEHVAPASTDTRRADESHEAVLNVAKVSCSLTSPYTRALMRTVVEQHVLSLVPDMGTLPSVESLALALELTRHVDRMAGPEPLPSNRRDEDIFTRQNINGLASVVNHWCQHSTNSRPVDE